jgi:hypothetical protein
MMDEHWPEVFPLYVQVQTHQFGQVERQSYHEVPPNIPGDRLIQKLGPALIQIPEPGFVPHDQNRGSPSRSVVTTPPETFRKFRQNTWRVLSAPQLEPTLDFFL